jgi:branched-chain amino acid transport system substrate-binding protein
MSGKSKEDGEAMVRGIELYLDQVNKQGGINGKKITYVLFDDENTQEQARRQALKIAGQDKFLVVLGHFYSSTSIAGGEIYQDAGIPAITGSATADDVTEGNNWYFRVIFNNRLQGTFLANYTKRVLKRDTVSIIYDQDNYGSSLTEAFENKFSSLGGTIKYKWRIDSDIENSNSEAIEEIVGNLIGSKSDPGTIFLATHTNEAVLLIVSMRRKGLNYPFIGADALSGVKEFGGKFSKYPEEQVKKGFFSDDIYVASPLIFGLAGKDAQDFRNAYRNKYQEEPGWVSAHYYDAALAAVQAIKACSLMEAEQKQEQATLSQEERRSFIRGYLANRNSPKAAIKGITGKLYFDQHGDVVTQVNIGTFKKQHFIPAMYQVQPITDLNRITDLQLAMQTGCVIIDSKSKAYKTKVIYTGIDINQISDINIANSSFTVDFYLWFRYQGEFNVDEIEFINAVDEVETGTPISERIPNDAGTDDSVSYKAYRIKADFKGQFAFQHYPFDRQELVIRFRHKHLTRENLIFVKDSIGMNETSNAAGLARLDAIGDYHLQQADFFQDIVRNNSTLGDPLRFNSDSDIEFSRFNAVVRIKRNFFGFVVKNLLPLFVVAVVIYLSFFINEFSVNNAILRSALLAVAFFHIRLANELPGVGYTVALDYAFYIFYVLIVFAFIITIMVNKIKERKQGSAKNTMKRLICTGRIIYPGIILISILSFAVRYDLFVSQSSLTKAGRATVELPSAPVVKKLRILQWKHFIPQYDQWFDAFASKWGELNGVKVTVTHVNLAEIQSYMKKEIEIGNGHDLIEFLSPPSQFEPYVLDLTDVNVEAQARFGEQFIFCTKSSYNSTTGKWYGFSPGWAPDPGNYRKSLWEQVNMPGGPITYDDLLKAGSRIRNELGIQLGIGISNELDSNLAIRAILWSFGGAVQDKNENVIINSPETLAAVKYIVELYNNTMTQEVFHWTALSNNQGFFAGQLSYILNSISAYRTAQELNPEVGDDVFFVPPLQGPTGLSFASPHVISIYAIPEFSTNSEEAKEFLLYLVENYEQASLNSKLYNFPAWKQNLPELNVWLDQDPYGSKPVDKLAVLKKIMERTTNIGNPGQANAAVGEVFDSFILPKMVARVARGEMTAKESINQAERQIVHIFDKWRAMGLVGGGNKKAD